MSEEIYLNERPVTAEVYRAALAKDKSLPKWTGKAGKPFSALHASVSRDSKLVNNSKNDSQDCVKPVSFLRSRAGIASPAAFLVVFKPGMAQNGHNLKQTPAT